MTQLSSYADNLEKKGAKACYKEKTALINRVDPFGKVTEGEQCDGYPLVEDCDLVFTWYFEQVLLV